MRRDLVQEGRLSSKKKDKYLFGEVELVNFSKAFWTVDNECFVHPRNKLQIPFLLLIYCWTGARIGAFGPPVNTAGLCYKVFTSNDSLGVMLNDDSLGL